MNVAAVTAADGPLSNQEIEILRHTLGTGPSGRDRSYRNHFVTGPGGNDHVICLGLVDRGIMRQGRPSELSGGMDVFWATDAGKAAAAACTATGPKLTRGQKRYLAYLNADSHLKFGEWLKKTRG